MSRVARWIVAGYPAAWRERYGDEITTLIEDSGGGWGAALDVLRGGVKMHFRGRNFLVIAAVLGLAGAVAGLGAWWNVIQTPGLDLYKEERKTIPLEVIFLKANHALSLDVEGFTTDGVLFNLAFRYRERYTAQRVVRSLFGEMSAALAHAEKLDGRNETTAATIVMKTFPSKPLVPEAQARSGFVLCGFGTGILAAMVLTLMFRRSDPDAPVVAG